MPDDSAQSDAAGSSADAGEDDEGRSNETGRTSGQTSPLRNAYAALEAMLGAASSGEDQSELST